MYKFKNRCLKQYQLRRCAKTFADIAEIINPQRNLIKTTIDLLTK